MATSMTSHVVGANLMVDSLEGLDWEEAEQLLAERLPELQPQSSNLAHQAMVALKDLRAFKLANLVWN